MPISIAVNGETLLFAAQEGDHAPEPDDHAAEGGEEHGGSEASNPILPEPNEIFWGGLSFLVLVVLMVRFLVPAVQKGMEARTNRIRQSLDDAERTKDEAQRLLEDYQRQLAGARNESSRIIEEARQTADQLRRDLMARAEADVAELRQRSQEDIAAAQERAMADLRRQVADLAVQLAEVIVERNLDRDTNNALIESYINSLNNQPAAR